MAEGDNKKPDTTATQSEVDLNKQLEAILKRANEQSAEKIARLQKEIELQKIKLEQGRQANISAQQLAAIENEIFQNQKRMADTKREADLEEARKKQEAAQKQYQVEMDLLKKLNEEERELRQEIINMRERGTDEEKKQAKELEKLIKDQLTEQLNKVEKVKDTLKEQNDELEKQKAALSENEIVEAKLASLKEQQANRDELITNIISLRPRAVAASLKKMYYDPMVATKKQLQLEQRRSKELKRMHEQGLISAESLAQMGEATLDANGKIASYGRSLPGASAGLRGVGKAAGFAMKALGALGIVLAVAGVLINIFGKKSADTAKELREQEVNLKRTAGVTDDFADAVQNAAIANQQFAVSIADSYAQAKALTTTFTDFTMQSTDTVNMMVKMGAVLSRFGMTAENFAQSIQNSTKAMGMSAEGAAQNLINLEKYARDIGVPFEQMSANFAQAGNMMAKMGAQGTQSFRNLSLVAKRTGMDLQRLIAITEKFDTFEGAATSAGKLNAAIGRNFVNAMDLMMEEDPAQRFMMIRDAIMQTGLTFDDMTYKQKIFYAEAAGLQDVSELALLMSGRMDLLAGATNRSAQSYEEAAERAKSLATFQEEMNKLMTNLAVATEPLVEGLNTLVEYMNSFGSATRRTHSAVAVEQHSPTFLDTMTYHLPAGLKMTSQMMDAATSSTQRMTTTVRQGISGGETSLPNYAQTMVSRAEAPISAMNQAAPGRNTSSTVSQQPITVQVGDKPLVKMVLDTIADHGAGTIGNMIKNINQ